MQPPCLATSAFARASLRSSLAPAAEREVANQFSDHDWISAPIVDENNILLGRITIDDVVDIIRKQAELHVLLAAGKVKDKLLGQLPCANRKRLRAKTTAAMPRTSEACSRPRASGGRIHFEKKPNIDPMAVIGLIQGQLRYHQTDGPDQLRLSALELPDAESRIKTLRGLLLLLKAGG